MQEDKEKKTPLNKNEKAREGQTKMQENITFKALRKRRRNRSASKKWRVVNK